MHSVTLTYDQAVAVGQLTRDEQPDRLTVTNPNGYGQATIFVAMYADDGSLTQHAIDTDGCVSTMAQVAA